MLENVEQAKERLKEIVDFYKLNDENNYDYSDDVLISIRIVLEEIERLNNIIKEVREYIENKLWNYFDERNIYLKVRDEFLEILDKEVN